MKICFMTTIRMSQLRLTMLLITVAINILCLRTGGKKATRPLAIRSKIYQNSYDTSLLNSLFETIKRKHINVWCGLKFYYKDINQSFPFPCKLLCKTSIYYSNWPKRGPWTLFLFVYLLLIQQIWINFLFNFLCTIVGNSSG